MRAKVLALLIGLFCLANVAALQAQTRVVVLDMGAVFDAHPDFQGRVEALKAEIKAFDDGQKMQRDTLMEEARRLQTAGLDASNPQFRTSEASIASRTANLEVEKRLKVKEFAQKEAAIYYEVYRDVAGRVNNYCKENEIEMVIHFNSKEMTAENPASIMARMNSNVVYYRPQVNITPQIVQLCGGNSQPASFQQPAQPNN